MVKYGYLSEDYSTRRSSSINNTISEAIVKFQKFYGLDITGVLSDETRSIMEMPRCGMKDIDYETSASRRHKLDGSKWSKNKITYRVSKYTKQIKMNSVDDVFKRAFKMWSDVTDLKFKQKKKGSGDIDIQFNKGYHGHKSRFDGPHGVLAHASYPRRQKTYVHFDDEETFTDGQEVKKGINLLQVAVHEFGHSLGLHHSEVNSSIMFPSYHRNLHNVKLHSDDIRRIQALYGKNPSDRKRTRTSKTI